MPRKDKTLSSGSGVPVTMLPPDTYWVKAPARRVSFLVDSAAYFAAALRMADKAAAK